MCPSGSNWLLDDCWVIVLAYWTSYSVCWSTNYNKTSLSCNIISPWHSWYIYLTWCYTLLTFSRTYTKMCQKELKFNSSESAYNIWYDETFCLFIAIQIKFNVCTLIRCWYSYMTTPRTNQTIFPAQKKTSEKNIACLK